jgi:2-methylcitrate dehydratase PrpD
VAEELKASGEAALEAFLIGFEVETKLGAGMNPYLFENGWHPTAILGAMGAAAASAKLLKLPAEKICMALGIAASLASGLRQNFGTMTKPLHAGQAAANGIQAALLAQAGLTADDSIIETPLGFAKVFGHDQEVDWEKASEGLGKTFNITALSTNGIAIKPYPSCGCTHAGIDAALHSGLEGGREGLQPQGDGARVFRNASSTDSARSALGALASHHSSIARRRAASRRARQGHARDVCRRPGRSASPVGR